MQQWTVEILDNSVPQVVKEIVQVDQFAPQERLLEVPVLLNLANVVELVRVTNGCKSGPSSCRGCAVSTDQEGKCRGGKHVL